MINISEMKLQSKNCNEVPYTIKELLEAMSTTDSFTHLQLILRHRSEIGSLPQRFLMVTPSNFGIVNLVDLSYDHEKVILHLQNESTKNISKTYIDIYDRHFKFLLINWQNIVELVSNDRNSVKTTGELLELDEK